MERLQVQFTFNEDGLNDAVYFDMAHWESLTRKQKDELKASAKQERIAKHKAFVAEQSSKASDPIEEA